MLRRFLKDSVIYAIPTFVSRGLAFLLVPLYTRILNPSDFGALDMLLVFGGLVNLTVAFEVSQGAARYYMDEPDPQRKKIYVSSAFWFTVGCYGLFMLLALASGRVLSEWVTGQQGLESVFRVGVVYIGVNGIFYLVQNQFRWELNSRRYAETSLLATFVTAAAVICFAYGLDWGLQGFLWGMALGAGLGMAYGLWWLRHSITWSFDRQCLWVMLKYSLPLVPSGMAVWVGGYMDRMMINHYLTLNEVGVYGIGFRLSSIVGLVVAGVQGALMPLVYAHYREPGTPLQLARIFRVFLAFALLVFLALSLFARDILVLMTTPDFYGAAILVIYLVPAAMLAQMYIFAPGIGIAQRTHLYIWLNLAGAVVNGMLGWWLVPLAGITGAAMASLAGSACVFVLAMSFSQRLYHVPHAWGRLVTAAVGALILALLIPQLSPTDVARRVLGVLGMGVLAGALIALGLVRRDEIAQAARELRARLGS